MSTINDYIDYDMWENERNKIESSYIDHLMTIDNINNTFGNLELFRKATDKIVEEYKTNLNILEEKFVEADKRAHDFLKIDNSIRKEMCKCIGTDAISNEKEQKKWLTTESNKVHMELMEMDENALGLWTVHMRIEVIKNMLNRLTNK
jgi:uncharacterized UPF0160 family protein